MPNDEAVQKPCLRVTQADLSIRELISSSYAPYFLRICFVALILASVRSDQTLSDLSSPSYRPYRPYRYPWCANFSVLCIKQYKFHWMQTLALPCRVNRLKRLVVANVAKYRFHGANALPIQLHAIGRINSAFHQFDGLIPAWLVLDKEGCVDS